MSTKRTWAEVYEYLEAERLRRGWTKVELYDRAVSEATYKPMKDGRPIKREDKRAELARGFGWSPDSIDRLLAGDDPIVETDPTPAHTWEGRTPDDLAALVAEVREFLTLAKQRRSDIDDMLAEAREVSAAARDASEGMADLVLAVAEIRDFVRRREAALARRPGELEP